MYQEATKMHNKRGIGSALYVMAIGYNHQLDHQSAIDCYEKALNILSWNEESHVKLLNDVYLMYVFELGEAKRHDLIGEKLDEWKRHLNELCKDPSQEERVHNWLYKYYLRSSAYHIHYQEYGKAEADIDSAEHHCYIDDPNLTAKSTVMNMRVNLELERGNYQAALEANDQEGLLAQSLEDGKKIAYLEHRQRIMAKLGRYKDAYELSLLYTNLKDSLVEASNQEALNELNKHYELDQLHTENIMQQQRQRFTTVGITMVLGITTMLILIVVNGRWHRRLETKNMQLQRERNIVVTQNQQLAVARDRAEKASQAKTAFMQSMTHEIRTPLNAISGFTQVLTMPGVELSEEEQLDMSEHIKHNTCLLTNILDDILEISDLESSTDLPAAEKCSASAIATQAASAVQPNLAKNDDGTPAVTLCTDVQVADDLNVSTHPHLLLMALSKLLDNAAKFTKAGSITITLSRDDSTLLYSIKDTGPGIPEDKKEYIFDRFTKLDSFAQGTGLGLAVARMIAERLGGSLTLDTSYKGGSKFDLRIPA